MTWRLLPVLVFLFGCTTSPETTRRVAPDLTLPPMKSFGNVSPSKPSLSNAQIGRDYLDLVFQLENGERVPVFSRFEGPITVRVTGKAPPTLAPDLDRLLTRFRSEAGIDISRVSGGPASITISPISRAQIQRAAPSAACFVRPNVSSWDEYRARRNDPETFWTRLTVRRSMAIFLPNDVSPQEVRDCLHEEIAQALGPVNDMYRLNDSIFNDDNFHTVLTGYDMLILATHYDDALVTGMTQAEVAERLPAILRRLNPRGGSSGIAPARPAFGNWERAISQATDPRAAKSRRMGAAERAVNLALEAEDVGARLAFAYYVLGRTALASDPDKALKAFLNAGRIYQSLPASRIQEAHVALQIAAFQLSAGRGDIAEQLINQNLDTVRQSQHAALLSLMLLLKAEAIELQNRPADAAAVQKEALAWARYGFGDEETIRDRAGEILAISPRDRRASDGSPT